MWPTAPGSKKAPGNGGSYLRTFLAPCKAPHLFPAAPLSTRAAEGSCPLPPAPRTSEIGAGMLSSHLHWPSCSKDEKNKLGIAPLIYGSLAGSNQAVSLLPAQLWLSLDFFLPLGNCACVSSSQTSSASCLKHGYSLHVPMLVHALGADPEPLPSDL